MIVGITGKTCSGKDTLAAYFPEWGFTVIDADALGRQSLEANRQAVEAALGTSDRAELRRRVFWDRRALASLEAITHPWIAAQIRRQLEGISGHVLLNVPLLHKQNLYRLCDVVIWVEAPLWLRILRARRRDRLSWVVLFGRIWAQRELRAQVFPADVDILKVDNRGSPWEARRKLEARFSRIPILFEREDPHEKQ